MAVKIKLKSENGKKFYFSVMPEEIHMKSAAKYQTFDVIRDGAVKVPTERKHRKHGLLEKACGLH